MNMLETLTTLAVVAVAATVVVRYVFRSLRAPESDCGCCEGCPSHGKPGGCAAQREGVK